MERIFFEQGALTVRRLYQKQIRHNIVTSVTLSGRLLQFGEHNAYLLD